MAHQHEAPLKKAFRDLQAFFDRWNLTTEEIIKILGISEEVYESWLHSGAMSFEPKIIARCNECYALHQALQLHFSEERAYAWVRRSNSAQLFGGRTAIATICEELEQNPKIIRTITQYVKASAVT